MADYREGLKLVPTHMWGAIKAWVENGEPYPLSMGEFFFSVLCNRLVESSQYADSNNRAALASWGEFLLHYMPEQSWGDEEKLMNWHQLKHIKS